MTLAKLLESDADTLDKLTIQELEAFFAPSLDSTRPERQKEKPKKSYSSSNGSRASSDSIVDAKLRKLDAMLKQRGLDIE